MAEEKKIYIPAAKKGEGISRFLSGFDLHDISWKPFIVLGVLFSILAGIAISINPSQYLPYIVGGIGGIIVFVLIFQKPECYCSLYRLDYSTRTHWGAWLEWIFNCRYVLLVNS